jgi:hypothetical protein
MLPLFFITSIVFAATQAEEEAELVRILEDMQNFRKRGNWAGVEKKYSSALVFRKAVVQSEIHLIAAESSSYVGNVIETKTRLERAIAVQPEQQKALEWLENINSNFGEVKIKVAGSYEVLPELTVSEMPFFPEQQQAIAFAKKALEEDRVFKGMLPKGEYSIGSETFNVQPRKEMQVINVVENLTLAYVGPRLDVGASMGRAGEADSEQLNSAPFGGTGTRIGVGVDVGLNDKMGVVTEVGYHGMRGAGKNPPEELISSYGFQSTPTKYHGAYGWLAGSYNFGQIRLLAGPTVEMASIQTQGVVQDNLSISTAVNGLDYIPIQGSVVSCGASGGITYYGFELGNKLNGGISALFGAQSDSTRMYSWGQIAFTMNGRN